MLRITPAAGIKRAKDYFTESLSRGDYYTEQQERIGAWGGKLADLLGLSGDVGQEAFFRLCENRHPTTGKSLTYRTVSGRRVGYDINAHPSKSLSIQFGITGDQEIVVAFEDAVDYAMELIESDVETRVRKGGANHNRVTGNLVWAGFTHLTARPIDGIPDPQIHRHCFTFNATLDPVEHAHKAIDISDVKRNGNYYQAAFHSRLRHNIHQIGYETRTTKDGKSFELAHITDEMIQMFSRRTQNIEQVAAERGITDSERKSELGARTRQQKAKALTIDGLRPHWSGRLTAEQIEVLNTAKGRPRSKQWTARHGNTQAIKAVAFARQHLFERDSVIEEKKLLEVALNHSQGNASLAQLQEELAKLDLLSKTIDGNNYVTTREMLNEEQRIVEFTRQGVGNFAPFSQREDFDDTMLSPTQTLAAKALLGSEDQVVLMRGAAGTGKTTLMKYVVEEIERTHYGQVFVTAPTIDAADMLKEEGFAEAQTIQRLLVNKREHSRLKNGVLWLDESGLLGTIGMSEVFALAEEQNARVILTGDEKQHRSVLRGSPLWLLKMGGVESIQLTEIRRQAGEYKRIVHRISEGEYCGAFEDLDRKGWVKEMETTDAHQEIAREFRRMIIAKGSTVKHRPLAISPTHKEKDELTKAIRTELFHARWLSGEDRTFECLESLEFSEAERKLLSSYQEGRVVQFFQHMEGFKAGTRATVDSIDETGNVWMKQEGSSKRALNLEQSDRFDVFATVQRQLAIGDPIRITTKGKTKYGKHLLKSGSEYEVRGFDGPQGDIQLMNGWTIKHDFGHWDNAFVKTSHASQGKTASKVLVAQSAKSFGASNAEQFYVSVSRGKNEVTIYTDDKEQLAEKIRETERFKNAADLEQEPDTLPTQQREQDECQRKEQEREPSL